eukprot:4940289-Pleurochrysis_carterae.AAC.1
MGEGERQQRELDGAGGVCATASVATVNARPVGKPMKSSQRYLALTNIAIWSLPAPTSDRHALGHVVDCRFSARGNLHRDLNLAASRPAVFAHPQFSGY